jgi:hypothetical protein
VKETLRPHLESKNDQILIYIYRLYLFLFIIIIIKRIHVEEKEDGTDLVFETIRKKNQGDYSCKATVRGQEVEKKFTLSVFSNFFKII